MTTLSEAQQRDLRLIASGFSRGDSANTCESLCRSGLLQGDWVTGYYVTPKGQRVAQDSERTREDGHGYAAPDTPYTVRWTCAECDHVYVAEYESEEAADLADRLEGENDEVNCPRHGADHMTGDPVDADSP